MKMERLEDILEAMKGMKVTEEDIKKMEEQIKLEVLLPYYKELQGLKKKGNIIKDITKYAPKKMFREINLLEALYRFETRYQADATVMWVKIDNEYYGNIFIYVPISENTYRYLKAESGKLIQRLNQRKRYRYYDLSPEEIPLSEGSIIENDEIGAKLTIKAYSEGKVRGSFVFYYIDYRRVRRAKRY